MRKLSEGKLGITGTLDSGNERQEGIRYAAIAGVKLSGKKSRMHTHADGIEVSDADEAWIIVSANTSYMKGEIYQTETQRLLDQALVSDLTQANKKQPVNTNSSSTVPASNYPKIKPLSQLSTDKRLEAFQTQDDPSLGCPLL